MRPARQSALACSMRSFDDETKFHSMWRSPTGSPPMTISVEGASALTVAGPRASQYLVLGAKARAVLHGRYYVNSEDIRAVAFPVLRHRIMTNFNAEAEGVKPDDIIRHLIDTVPADETAASGHGRQPEIFRSADAG